MISTPTVSVVIPAYNAQAFIQQTLACVVGQLHENLEVVVVDDGSTDATASVVSRMASFDSRLRLLRKSNGGVCAARNTGLEDVSGRFVMFVDADDLLFPWSIRDLVRAHRPDQSFVFGRSVPMTADGMIQRPPAIRWVHEDAPAAWIRGNRVKCGSGVLVPTELAQEVGGFDESLRDAEGEICGDWLFYLRLRELGPTGYRPIPTVAYRRRGDSMSAEVRGSLEAADAMYRRVMTERSGFYSVDIDRVMSAHAAAHAGSALAAGDVASAASVIGSQPRRRWPRIVWDLATSRNSEVSWRRPMASKNAVPDGFPLTFDKYVSSLEADDLIERARRAHPWDSR